MSASETARRSVCLHKAPTLYSHDRGFALKLDCGRRAYCYPVRRRWRRQLRQRLELVEYRRVPFLWTITARPKEQDAEFLARRFVRDRLRRGETVAPSVVAHPESLAPYMREARDRGDPHCKEDVAAMSAGVSRLVRLIHEQHKRQRRPGYDRSRKARELKREYGEAYVVRGKVGADFRVRVKEAGERRGRLHMHAVSDYDYVNHAWLTDVACRCGLGFVHYRARETEDLQRRARSIRSARELARYLSKRIHKYLSEGDGPDEPWPWPKHTHLVSTPRGALPPRPRASDCAVTGRSVARVAIEELDAVWVDEDATFFSVRSAVPGQVVPGASALARSIWG